MFNKLKSFSEDVAKSFNEIQQLDPHKKNGDLIERLKNSLGLLSKKTPEISDLTQPTDEDPDSKDPLGSEGETGTIPKNILEKIPASGDKNEQESEKSKSALIEPKDMNSGSDLKNTSPDPLKDINLDELPPIVRSKLKKFVKYEEKYPVLLDAYKTEKRKGELIPAFEKVMSEVTPVLSIADVGLLVDYLKGLTEKATLLNNELRKAMADTSKINREKEELTKKLTDTQKTLKYAEESLGQKSTVEEEYKAKIKLLEENVLALETQISSSSVSQSKESDEGKEIGEIEQLKSQLLEKEHSLKDAEKRFDESKKQLEKTLQETKENLQKELDLAKSTSNVQILEYEEKMATFEKNKTKLSTLKEEIKTANKAIKEYEAQVKDLQVSSENQDKLKKNVDSLTLELETTKASFKQLEDKASKSQNDVEDLGQQVSLLTEENGSLKKMVDTHATKSKSLTEKIESLEIEIKAKLEQINSLNIKLENTEKELAKAQETAATPIEQPKQIPTSSSSSGKKKKNKKNNTFQAPAIVSASSATTSDESSKREEELLKEKEELLAKLEHSETEKKVLVEEIEKLKEDLEDKGKLLTSAKSELEEKEKTLAQTSRDLHQKEELVKQLEVGKNATQKLEKDLSTARRELEAKTEDLEHLRDLLKDVGNELVTAKESLKEAKQKWTAAHEAKVSELKTSENSLRESLKTKEENHKKAIETKELEIKNLTAEKEKLVKAHESEVDRLNSELEKVQASSTSVKSKLAELQKSAAKKDEELIATKKQVLTLLAEKEKLNERIGELSKFKSADSSLKLEVASLQSSISHKDEQIKDLKETLERKNKERDELKNSIATLKATNNDLHSTNQRLSAEKTKLIEKQESVMERANALASEISNLQVSRQQTVTQLDALKLKHEALQRTRSSASDEILEYKQQYEELAMKSKEAQNKIDDLQDELSEAKNLLQERTRESATMRRMLLEAEEEHTIRCNELKSEIRNMGEEQAETESNFQTLMKKRQREIEELKGLCERYVGKISELEKTIEEVRQRYEPLKNSRIEATPEDLQKQKDLENTVDELRASLQSSSKKVKDYENMNSILKKLNEESTLKFERLSKNYKHMTHQYRQMKEAQDRNGPSASQAVKSETAKSPETNVAYLKNVLVGFLEHKEQREQLLPVLKMLFQFDSEDEKKLMLALR